MMELYRSKEAIMSAFFVPIIEDGYKAHMDSFLKCVFKNLVHQSKASNLDHCEKQIERATGNCKRVIKS